MKREPQIPLRGTEPHLPQQRLAGRGKLEIRHYYGSLDAHRLEHGPPHVHIIEGERTNIRIGQNGHPLRGQPELTAEQREFVRGHSRVIRRAIKKIGRWYRYHHPVK